MPITYMQRRIGCLYGNRTAIALNCQNHQFTGIIFDHASTPFMTNFYVRRTPWQNSTTSMNIIGQFYDFELCEGRLTLPLNR